MMLCPNCKTPLSAATYKKITIHECHTCKGMFFEGKELPQALEKKDDDLRWADFSLFEEKHNKYENTSGKKTCPTDGSVMYTLKYMDSGVFIDKCETCGGVWLDKKEFQAIITYLENLLIHETASDYAKDAWRKFTEIGTHEETIFSEIKDFLVVLKLFEMKLVAENPSLQTIIEKTYQYIPYN